MVWGSQGKNPARITLRVGYIVVTVTMRDVFSFEVAHLQLMDFTYFTDLHIFRRRSEVVVECATRMETTGTVPFSNR